MPLCPICDEPYHQILTIDTKDEELDWLECSLKELPLVSCVNCSTCWERQYYHIDEKERTDLVKKILPRIYQAWLDHNLMGVMGETGIKIYGLQELEERNITFECSKYLPLYVAVGDDSGDTLYFMRRDVLSKVVYAGDVGSMIEASLVIVNNDFNKWIEGINEAEELEDNDDSCAVYMETMPDNIKDIICIKNFSA